MSEVPDDGRDSKALTATENADLCQGCVTCCTYITVEVDAPRAAWEYDQWIWALHHTGIEMYVERPEHWYLHIATVCRQLNHDGRCKIHGRHPVLCREYDPRSCERRLPLGDQRAWFHNAEELEAWLARERPSHFKRLMAHRKDRPAAGDGEQEFQGHPSGSSAGALIPLLSLAGTGGRRTGRG